MQTVLEILNLSTEYLKQKGVAHARRQAENLLGEALKIGRMGLYLEYDRPLVKEELDRCRNWLKRRGQGEPLQYILESVDFFNCRIEVTPDVLIPRQETEILVDKISKEMANQPFEGKILWDLCCGSGCIGIALKRQFPSLKMVLSDLSSAALKVAKRNAEKNGVETEFLEGDLLEPFQGRKADFIVCNPPYIGEGEFLSLEREVRQYEPKMALVSGKTGLELYQRLARDLPGYLNSGGQVWLEIGAGQGEAIREVFQAPCWKTLRVECDWANHQRFFSLEIE